MMGAVASVMVLLGAARQSHADIITTLVGSPVQSGNQYLYTYDVELSFDSQIAPNMPMPEFGTLYDYSNQLPAVQNVTGDLLADFAFTYSLTNTAAYKVAPTDSSALYNIRFTYTGNTTLVGAPYDVVIGGNSVQVGTNLLDLGQFTLTSPTNITQSAFYDGQSFNSFGASAGTPQGNVGSTVVPAPVPEPTCLGILGIGAFGLLGRRRRA